MRLSPLLTAAAATALTAAGVIALPATAQAAGSCSLYAPGKISIGASYRVLTIKEGPNCAAAGVVDAGWTAVSTAGDVDSIILENSARSGPFYVFGDDPLGKWTWRPEGAFDAADNQIFQYTPVTDVRLASYSRITPTRTGTKVNLKTLANRWWGNGDKFIGYASARGQIQYRTPGTTTWHSLKDVYSSSTGTYSYTYNTTLTRDYRVVIYDAPTNTIWGSTSPTVRK